ncbi:MAG: patatin [Bacteroidetes bacterium]|nr:patatin [Bacteroidota bacterium]
METKSEKIGLALGGGVVYGSAHIGVLRALEERDIKVDHVSGTSIGALVGALYVFGLTWQQIRAIALELKWLNIATVRISKYGLLSNHKIKNLVMDHIGDVNFEDAPIPLSVVATNIENGKKVIIESGKVADAVLASTCIPGVFAPYLHNKKMLVDGGLVENVPISPLRKAGADSVIAVDLNGSLGIEKPSSIVDVLMNSFELMLNSASSIHARDADVLISPDLSPFSRTDLDRVEEMIEVGYLSAIKELDNLNSPRLIIPAVH